MKMRTSIAALAVALSSTTLSSQTDIPEFDKLRTPASPAFVILGTTPSEVQRPTTPSSFAVSLLQGFVPRGGDEEADGFALEAAPYWLVSHPDLTLRRYYNATPLESLVRTFTVSLATAAVDDDAVPSGSSRDLGAGLRFQLFSGRPPTDSTCIASTQATIGALTGVARFIQRAVNDTLGKNPALASDATTLDSLQDRYFQQALKQLSPADKKVVESETMGCAAVLSARRGFVMDVAGASAWRFSNGEVGEGSWRAGSIWATPSIIHKNFSIVGVARYTWSDEDADEMTAGLRSVYARDRYGASLEAVLRRPDDAENEYRVSLIFDYLLTEDLWLTTSFGREFRQGDEDALLAVANFQWNVGDRSVHPQRR